MKERINKAVEAGELAFWEQIAKAFPEARTGDFPPEAVHAHRFANREAVELWVRWNLPTTTHDVMKEVCRLLDEKFGIAATFEYPGYIAVGDVSFGTENPKWGFSIGATGLGCDLMLPSYCQDAEAIAFAIESVMNPDDDFCACGGTMAVPCETHDAEYAPCPDCAKRFPHDPGPDGVCSLCGLSVETEQGLTGCPDLHHPHRIARTIVRKP